jgi:hypothetical protein
MKYLFIAFFICFFSQRGFAEIKVVLTAALTDSHFEFRKNEYIQSFTRIIQYGYSDFYIVEALKKNGPTFLDDYSNHVFYATTNNPNCLNQGINESKTLLEALDYFNFDPEDMIIKLTGRHRFLSDYFLRTVESNPGYDAFVRYCSGLAPAFVDGMIPTMCFAMKCKYLKEMYESIDYKVMEQQDVPIEWIIASFIARKHAYDNLKVFVVDRLDIRLNAFASSASPGQEEKIYIF